MDGRWYFPGGRTDVPPDLMMHDHYLKRDVKGWRGMRLDISGKRRRGTDYRWLDMSRMIAEGAVMDESDMSQAAFMRGRFKGASMCGVLGVKARFDRADLRRADFDGASLSYASFRKADLRGASFHQTDLRGADFTGARLDGVRLDGADIGGAEGVDDVPMACPMEGAFTGYMVEMGFVLRVEVPAGAARVAGAGRVCRAAAAVVRGMETFEGVPADDVMVTVPPKPDRAPADAVWPPVVFLSPGDALRVGYEFSSPAAPLDRWDEYGPGIRVWLDRDAAVADWMKSPRWWRAADDASRIARRPV